MLVNPLARDVAIVVVAKLLLVTAAAVFVFRPDQLPKIDANIVAARLMGGAEVPSNARTTAP
jgi:hypothetical protein